MAKKILKKLIILLEIIVVLSSLYSCISKEKIMYQHKEKKVFIIIPHESFGPIKLGMARSEVVSILGKAEYHKNAEIKYGIKFYEKDFYYNNSLQISYDEHNIVEFVEAGKDKEIIYEIFGNNVFELSWKDFIRLLEEKSEETIKEDEKITDPVFFKLDIGLYREDDSLRYADSIGIGIKGYYK